MIAHFTSPGRKDDARYVAEVLAGMGEEPAIGEPVNVVGLDMDDRPQEPEMGHAKRAASMAEPDYDTDFSEWSRRQAELVRAGDYASLDVANVIEELESMGSEQRFALTSCYRVLIIHLLKWRVQPSKRSRSWRSTIDRERGNIEAREKTNRSLAKKANDLVADAYPRARRQAATETRLPIATFPLECPFTLAQLRDDEFMPD